MGADVESDCFRSVIGLADRACLYRTYCGFDLACGSAAAAFLNSG
jgi:hypothetical protein